MVGVIDWDFASPGPRLWDLVYLAYRIVPLSQADRADGFTGQEQRQRLHRLSAAYGTDADPREVSALLQQRLLDLAAFSELMALRLGKPELSDHATLYRHDVAHLPDTSA